MRFFNIVPVLPAQTDHMVSEAKRLYRECGISEPMLCMTLHPQGKPLEEKVETCRRTLRTVLDELQDTPVKVGVLFQTILGHRIDSRCEAPWQQVVNINHVPVGRYCILDPDYRNYLGYIIRTIAAEHPHSLMLDDDLRQIHGRGLECFCDRHMEQFNDGLDKKYTADELMQIIRDARPGDPLLLRFEALRQKNMVELARFIRRNIDEVAPGLECTCCTPSGEFRVEKDIACAVAGTSGPLIRLCNANYGSPDAREFPYIDYKTAFLIRMMRGVGNLIDEADTNPHNRYSQSAIALHSKLLLAALNGEKGAKLWLTDISFPDAFTERKYDGVLSKFRDFYPAVEALIKDAEPQGFITPIPAPEDLERVWHPMRFTDCYYKECWQYQLLSHYGIPGRFADAEADHGDGVVLLTRDMLRFYSDETIRKMLSGRVMMDQAAALALAERGFAAELGIKVVTEKYWTNGEIWNDSFRTSIPVPESDPDCPAKYCEPDSPQSVVLSRRYNKRFHHDQNLRDAGAGSILFDRRILITAMTLSNGVKPHHRHRRLLKKLLETILQGEIPLYVECDQNVFVKQFKLADDSTMLAVFNLNFDPLEGIELQGGMNCSTVEKLSPSGTWEKVNRTGKTVDLTLHTYEPVVLRLKNE